MKTKIFLSMTTFFFAVSFALAHGAFASGTNEISNTSGNQSGRRESTKSNLKAYEPSLRETCPGFLQSWVDDDFKDKTSWGFDFKSDAKTCSAPVAAYQDFLAQKNKSANFKDSAKLGVFLNSKFDKKLSSNYSASLANCNALAPEKALAIQTRFYAAGTKIEAVNASIVDEVAYLDSVLPASKGVLSNVECAAVMPELKSKCEAYKVAGASCDSSKPERFDDLVNKTQTALPIINGLIVAQQACLQKFYNEPGARQGRGFTASTQAKIKESCDPIGAAIELKKNEVPWVRGEDFEKLAVKNKSRPRNGKFTTDYSDSTDTIAAAITAQLNHNRDALSKTYAGNLEDFRCLSASGAGQSCDIVKLRSRLQGLPDLRESSFNSKDSADREAQGYFEAEKCIEERSQDREQTKAIVSSSASGIVLTAATFGVGEIIAGIRVVNAASGLAKVRQGLVLGNTGANMGFGGVALKHAYDTCAAETKSAIGVSKSGETAVANVCSGSKSAASQAKEIESNCVSTALLSAPSVLPFIAAVPSLRAVFAGKIGAVSEIANASSTGAAAAVVDSAKGIAWETLKARAATMAADINSGDPKRVSRAIQQIGDTKIDIGSLAKLNPSEYNSVIVGMTDKLRGVMSSSADPETKLAAMKAYAKYASENSGGYKQGALGRVATEEVGGIYNDYNLSDDVRRIAFEEMQKVNEAMKGSMYAGIYADKSFVTSASLRQADTISFLNKTQKSLSDSETRAYYTVTGSFKGASDTVKREIFDSLVSLGSIPKKYQGEYVSDMDLRNNNYFSSLDRLGFRALGSYKDKTTTYVNPQTGAQITIRTDYKAGEMLPSYSADEIAQMKDVILRGGKFRAANASSIPVQPGEIEAAKLLKTAARAEAAAAPAPASPSIATVNAARSEPIFHRDFRGMSGEDGGSIVGQKVEIPFTPNNSAETVVKGTVVRSYPAGMDVATADGKIVSVNANVGKIGSGTLTRSGPNFDSKRGESAMAILKGPVESGTYVIATIPAKIGSDPMRTEMAQVSGMLSKEKFGRTEVAVITDANGKKHYLNPDLFGRSQNFIELQVAKVKPEQVKDIKVTPESQITLYAVKESGAVKRARLAAEKKQAVVEATENVSSYALFVKMRKEKGTSLQSKMGFLSLPGDQPLPPGPILLLSPEKLKSLPNGTPVWSLIDGKRRVVGVDLLDDDTRGGMTVWGLRPDPKSISEP